MLIDLGDRLQARAQSGGGALRSERTAFGVLDEEHPAVTLIGVVRDGEYVAARAGLQALRAQLGPQPFRGGALEVGDRRRDAIIFEDHVAV